MTVVDDRGLGESDGNRATSTVTTVRQLTQAETTAAMLQTAAQNRSPLMIPGALERRAPPGRIAQPDATAIATTSLANPSAAHDRERLEYEREGGGAPSERRPRNRRRGALARLWRWAVRLPAPPMSGAAISAKALPIG